MLNLRKNFQFSLFILCLMAMILSSCSPTTPTAAPNTPPTAVPPTAVPPTAVPPTAVPLPQVGGTLTMALFGPPDTLDVYAAGHVYAGDIYYYLNATLVTLNLKGEIIPYLADSWTVSPDGITYTFKLHPGVKFTNGDPVTANDFVYAWDRASKDPNFKAPVSGGLLTPMASYKAIDDLTLEITLKQAQYSFITGLASPFTGPVSKKAVEAAGASYGHQPVGCGPYKFVEWVQDDHISLTRNPDFTWGPKYYDGASTGPGYIQNIVFRIIPEYSTQLAGLNSGDIDWIVAEGKDMPAIDATGKFTTSISPSLLQERFILNNSIPPFDDVRVRKAFTLALDRNAIVKVSLLGNGVVTKGPVGPAEIGYWPGVEDYGPNFDLAAAKQLMQDAGYTYDANGMLQKDGKPFKVTVLTESIDRTRSFAQIAQQMWKALGVDITLEEMDFQTEYARVTKSDFTIGTFGIQWTEADIMYILYRSGQLGQSSWMRNPIDPKLDSLLDLTRTEIDPAKRQEAVDAAEKYIVDNAYEIWLYSFTQFNVVNNRVKGLQYNPYFTVYVVPDAYIQP
jgi:peptide/nickel transport system substrate-binding protein